VTAFVLPLLLAVLDAAVRGCPFWASRFSAIPQRRRGHIPLLMLNQHTDGLIVCLRWRFVGHYPVREGVDLARCPA
jgi:hypothetical protein